MTEPSPAQEVLQATQQRLRILSLNRPARRNALSMPMCMALVDAATDAAHDAQVAALLLRGEGGTFCVGGDVKAMAAGGDQDLPVEARIHALRRRMDIARVLHTMPKPVVAAIGGAAAGAGLSIALACDFRIAARSAKFTTAFAKVGLPGDFGGSWFLTHMVGSARARELYLRPQTLSADEALALGLVTRVVDDASFEDEALAFAAELAAGPSVALGYMKRNLNAALTLPLDAALDLEAEHHVRCTQTADHQEAAAAFVQKRSAVFTGR